MTETDFRHLVARLERECDIAPERYRFRVKALATLGYAYAVGMLALCVAGVIGGIALVLAHQPFIGGKLALFSIVSTALVVRGLWVRLDPPKGRRIGRDEAPHLWRLIDKLRAKQPGPQIHEIIVDDEFNASIVQTPRLGVLGWYRNTLTVGLPLMQALSPKEFAAVVAHEYGHLSGAHGKSGAWIYRTRLVWMRLATAFSEEDGWFDKLFTRFFRWYFPWFNAYSFVLARQQEYEADRAAAHFVGRSTMGAALVAASVKGRFMSETFWPGLYAQADHQPRPGFLPHASLRMALRVAGDSADFKTWMWEALAKRTTYDDTHPCLRDRLEALRVKPVVPAQPAHSAAQVLLRDALGSITADLDAAWLRRTEADWRERHNKVQAAQMVIDRFAGSDPRTLKLEDKNRFALAMLTLDRKDEALPLLRDAAEQAGGSAETAMAAGRLLAEAGDDAAVKYFNLAMDRDGDIIAEATWRVAHLYEQIGNEALAKEWHERYERIMAD
ncbi:M48 family metalloprotease [Niveibacterium sp. 24ML]|uniref:M48 family metallopeptidase n=1 Tax=Niveibacterium sp. 24ML TaxID=2985512 RepID=UPI00226E94CB|nr:M48 family metallopeptidase [Niveibacterium sp. 24ML]MCX9157994.1 M48 family metalloprotease [Niveibacterium sp. 24ML]